MSYHRPLSPGGRRIQNQGRASDNLTDPYYGQRHNSTHNSTYSSPRTSTGGVIPISSQTFVNMPPPAGTRTTEPPRQSERYDAYSGRPRKSSVTDGNRGAPPPVVNQIPTRNRPAIVQNDFARPSSPLKGSARDKDYYVTPAASREPRKMEHKKLYSVDDGTAKLVADVDTAKDRHHKRRESMERGYRMNGGMDRERERGRRPPGYHMNGNHGPLKEKNINDDDAYSYTDAAGMYRDTEPRWREARPRRGSVDRGGASRERSASLLDPAHATDGRSSFREIGPPPSTRGWDKINDGLGRTRSARDGPRTVAQSPTRGRFAEQDSLYPPRNTSSDRRNTIHHDSRYEPSEYDERREPRRERRASVSREPRPERRPSVTRAGDRSVERRGFGIRQDSRDRHGRGSDESFTERKQRDAGYVEPHRRDTVSEIPYHDEKRMDQEKKDRLPEDRDRPRDRDARERDGRKREDDRGYDRDYDYDRERDRPRDRDREYERERDFDRERHHHRRDTDRRDDGDSGSQPSNVSKGAAGGLASAAAAFGLGKFLNKDKNKDNADSRDKDRERERDRDRDVDRERRYDDVRPERRNRPPESYSDEHSTAPYDRDSDRDRYRERDGDRGLGFAFEGPTQKPSPPIGPDNRDRGVEQDHEDKTAKMPAIPPQAGPGAVDADEDYRRRMEQVQRELGQPIQQDSDSDPDRERRRREREQRQRERDNRPGVDLASTGNVGPNSYNETPPPPSTNRSFEEESEISSQATSSTAHPGLKRRPSIIDQPMNMNSTDGMMPGAQILDNSMSDKRENRVRIVDPPNADDDDGKKPKGILKRPTDKFPEAKNVIREGVAPLKDATKKGIPPGARWTKIDRRLVNPEALDEAKERFEERLDCVIVLRVLTKEEIQKLADRTSELREERYEEERTERKESRRRDRKGARKDDDDYSEEDSEFEFSSEHRKPPKMLEAPSGQGMSSSWTAPGVQPPSSQASGPGRRDRDYDYEHESDGPYNMSGGLGRRE